MPSVIGHRGASAFAPENTVASFKMAHALGCRLIEFDVMLSADGEPFIFHDETLDRTTNAHGEFAALTSSEVRLLDAGSWFSEAFAGEAVPSLSEALIWMGTCDAQVNIEIKPTLGAIEQTTLAVLSQINRDWPAIKSWPLISSFELEALQLCRSVSNEIPIGLLLDQWRDDWWLIARQLRCYSIHLNYRLATRQRIADIKALGYVVCVYTVNDQRLAQYCFEMGIDAIFSDYAGFDRIPTNHT